MSLNKNKNFLPNFCSIRMVFVVVMSAELLAIVLALASYSSLDKFWMSLSLLSLNVQWVALFSTALLCVLKKGLNRLDNTKAGFVAWFVVLMVTLIVTLLSHQFLHVQSSMALQEKLIRDLLIAAIIAVLILRYLYDQYQIKQSELAEAESRVQALQARIRPHFLFNSMNTIASLTRVNAELAEQTVMDLSDLFRASLGDASTLSTLEKEFELAKGYLRIEAQRLGDRMKVTWDIDELPKNAALPGLLLQPLLENAVYHGIEPSHEEGLIQIVGRFKDDAINLSIRNTLSDTAIDTKRQGNQMALENIKQRLAAVFDGKASFTVSRIEMDYQVRLHFPYIESRSSDVHKS